MPLINGMKMAWYVLLYRADLTMESKTQAPKRDIIPPPYIEAFFEYNC
jgi:hypothetical protein